MAELAMHGGIGLKVLDRLSHKEVDIPRKVMLDRA